MEITKRDYWDKLCCDAFNHEELKLELLDFGFVAGISRCARYLQQALNLIGFLVEVDSIVGPDTVSKANSATSRYAYALM